MMSWRGSCHVGADRPLLMFIARLAFSRPTLVISNANGSYPIAIADITAGTPFEGE